MPPPSVLQRALREITERLAAELTRPTSAPPPWTPLEWKLARAVAAMHGISSLLLHSLRWDGPRDWLAFLDSQHRQTALRHQRLQAALIRLDEESRRAGLAAVALKGAALYSLGLYAPGDRPMADIDLLVRPEELARAARLIEEMGFQEEGAAWNAREFIAKDAPQPASFGEHADNAVKIELHSAIGAKLPFDITDITDLVFPARTVPGFNAYPSRAALMLHLVLHAADALPPRSVRLMHLNDLALLGSRMSGEDWREFLSMGSTARPLWWAFPPLALTARYFRGIPPSALASLARLCPAPLRTLAKRDRVYDVSYSYPWVNAFPGIVWSRSLREAARYAASRLRPSAAHLSQRATASKEAWAKDAEWSTLPQGRRILRWATTRQPRPLTMHVVRAALAQST